MLLDTHIFQAIVENRLETLPLPVRQILETSDQEFFLSVASLWEVAIKHRLGKLPLSARLNMIPDIARNYGIELMSINEHHALHTLSNPSRSPVIRLIAYCLPNAQSRVSSW